MFYGLMYRRGLKQYRRNYVSLLLIFTVSLTILCFFNIYRDSVYYYDEAVLIPKINKERTCDIRIFGLKEEEMQYFVGTPNTKMKYENGNIDIFLDNLSKAEETKDTLVGILRKHHPEIDYNVDTKPWLSVYYNPPEIDTDDRLRDFNSALSAVFAVIVAVTLIIVYSDYIKTRSSDIRTLSALGITGAQLNLMFFIELTVLFLISAVISIPISLGGSYLCFELCQTVGLSETNYIFPVFHCEVFSLVSAVLFGYAATLISFFFCICIKRVVSLDASYTCAEASADFNPDRSRAYYFKSPDSFVKFFSSVLAKRGTKSFNVCTLIVSFMLANAIFWTHALYYTLTVYIPPTLLEKQPIIEIVNFISNFSYIFILVFACIIYSLILVWYNIKYMTESSEKAVNILYMIGADEDTVYKSFKRYTYLKIIFTVIIGMIIGYAATLVIFDQFDYEIKFTLWYIPANLLVLLAYYLTFTLSMKKNFEKNCRSTVYSGEGEENADS